MPFVREQSGGTLAEYFPLTMSVYANGSSGSNGIAVAPIFFKGINTINVKVSGNVVLSACKYYELDSTLANGTVFPSTDFNIDVSNIDALYFYLYSNYIQGEHTCKLTFTVVN